ncbi:MAG: Flp pilus assembly complex ATPase component TadA, partial [Candidatus Omnitrophica bacterium]|nr:Flp pilus assembly complex ATPase component TadA [Candidatus Omnitrophota bacterium]
MLSFTERLKEILTRDGLVGPEDLARALEERKKFGGELSRILVKLKFLTQDQLSIVLSESLGIPIINLASFKVDPAVVKLVPKDAAQTHQLVPLACIGNQLTVAMSDPLDVFAIDNVKALSGMSVNTILARPQDIRSAIDRLYESDTSSTMAEILKDIKESEDLELVGSAPAMDKQKIESLVQEAPIITLTNTIIQQAVLAKASDVFIEPMENSLRVRYRVDGIIREMDRMSKMLHFPIVSRIKVVSTLDIAEHRLPQDGRFRTVTDRGKEVDFRVNVLPTALGEKVVLRVLDKNLEMLDLDKLGFQLQALERLKESCRRPHGMVLACGPTGSGKTTTLYAILKYIDSPGKNIITVEDPVEFQVKGFNQVNIRPEVGLTFPASLRSILRQDPDVILIGEVRDAQTLDIAVKAALTGHLVVTSLHTTTSTGSITRMINMGVEPFLICSSVNAIVAQRLIRRVCPKCREAYTITPEAAAQFRVHDLAPGHNLIFYRPKGCAKCFNTGYQGRVGITEVLI